MMNRKGFTLIELMIVIAIIGILAAMAVPNFKKSRAQARQKACYSNMRVINSAVEMYNMDAVGSSMMDGLVISDLTSSGYLKAAPTCPETGKSSSYSGSSLTTTGQVHCEYTSGEFTDLKHGYLDLSD